MKDRVKFISSLILFGSNGVLAVHIALPSAPIVFLRTLIGSTFLGLLLLIGRKSPKLGSARDTLFVTLSGIAMGLSWIFLYEAYRIVGVGISSIQYYCAPVIVMALTPVLFHERLTSRIVVSFSIVLAGALLINGSVDTEGVLGWGMFCGWMSALCHAAMVIFSKKADKVDGLASSFAQLADSFLVVAVFLIITGGLPFDVETSSWPWIIALGVVNTGLGCYLYFSSFEGLSAQSVAVLGYLEPLSAVACSALFLGEAMSAIQLVGSALIIAGAALGTLVDSRSHRTAQPHAAI